MANKPNIPPELLENIMKKWHELTFVAASFRRSGLLGPNSAKEVASLIRQLKRKRENAILINKKKGNSREV